MAVCGRSTASPPVALSLPPSVILIFVEHETVFFLRVLKLVVHFRELVLLILFILFKICLQTFKRRFTRLFFVGLHLFEGCWDDLFFYYVIVDSRRSEERRVGKECRSRWSPYH